MVSSVGTDKLRDQAPSRLRMMQHSVTFNPDVEESHAPARLRPRHGGAACSSHLLERRLRGGLRVGACFV
jgi:hypothetical protein